MAERQEETLHENHIEVEEVQERAEEDAKESAALKESPRTPSDAEGPRQEESREEPKKDSIQGEPGRSGKKKYVMALILLLCVIIGISGGLLIRAQYFSSPESASAAPQEYLYGLKPFFVPLSKNGSKKFLRLTISLNLSGSNSTTQIVTHIEKVRSGIMNLLVNIPPKNVENPQWKDLLAAEIASAVNRLVEGNVVKGVIINDLLVV
jgi:flagellar basal body-associated protein FliL